MFKTRVILPAKPNLDMLVVAARRLWFSSRRHCPYRLCCQTSRARLSYSAPALKRVTRTRLTALCESSRSGIDPCKTDQQTQPEKTVSSILGQAVYIPRLSLFQDRAQIGAKWISRPRYSAWIQQEISIVCAPHSGWRVFRGNCWIWKKNLNSYIGKHPS